MYFFAFMKNKICHLLYNIMLVVYINQQKVNAGFAWLNGDFKSRENNINSHRAILSQEKTNDCYCKLIEAWIVFSFKPLVTSLPRYRIYSSTF